MRDKEQPREQRWHASYLEFSGRHRSVQTQGERLEYSGTSHQNVFWRGLGRTNLLGEELDFGAEQESNPIPSEAVWVDSTWKCKAVGKRDRSSNGSLDRDFPAHK